MDAIRQDHWGLWTLWSSWSWWQTKRMLSIWIQNSRHDNLLARQHRCMRCLALILLSWIHLDCLILVSSCLRATLQLLLFESAWVHFWLDYWHRLLVHPVRQRWHMILLNEHCIFICNYLVNVGTAYPSHCLHIDLRVLIASKLQLRGTAIACGCLAKTWFRRCLGQQSWLLVGIYAGFLLGHLFFCGIVLNLVLLPERLLLMLLVVQVRIIVFFLRSFIGYLHLRY